MSSQSEMDYLCPICHEIFKDPVILECSHSFCKDCLQRWWSEKQIQKCPVCCKVSVVNDPPRNLALKNLCEAFLLEKKEKDSPGSEFLCCVHSEKFRLFCEDHQEPVCLVCRDSNTHKNHRFRPVNEAAQAHREKLQKDLEVLKIKQKTFEKFKINFDLTEQHIKSQTLQTKMEIAEQFRRLHKFLHDEENARITALMEEEDKKTKEAAVKIDLLKRQIREISVTISDVERKMKAADVSFLLNHNTSIKAIQKCLPLKTPDHTAGALIDVAKHLGNLNFNIWNKMKEIVDYHPLILDPNTAHPVLTLSNNLTSVTFGGKQALPYNPERFYTNVCVLSSQGLNSGTHSWDVEVHNDLSWGIGVINESARREEKVNNGFWEISCIDGIVEAASPPLPDKVLPVKNLQQVRVQLNWHQGHLSFYDVQTMKRIHTFRHRFTEKLYPYIGTGNKSPVRITPMSVTVTEQHAVPLPSRFWPF